MTPTIREIREQRKMLLECARMLRRGQRAYERQGWEKGESTEHWYHAAGQLAAQIEIANGLKRKSGHELRKAGV